MWDVDCEPKIIEIGNVCLRSGSCNKTGNNGAGTRDWSNDFKSEMTSYRCLIRAFL